MTDDPLIVRCIQLLARHVVEIEIEMRLLRTVLGERGAINEQAFDALRAELRQHGHQKLRVNEMATLEELQDQLERLATLRAERPPDPSAE